MQRRIPHTGVAGIPGEQLRPDRSDCDTVLLDVANYFVCEIEDILSRCHREGCFLVAYLLRKEVNMSLTEASNLFGVSCSRISQIQRKLDRMLQFEVNALVNRCKQSIRSSIGSGSISAEGRDRNQNQKGFQSRHSYLKYEATYLIFRLHFSMRQRDTQDYFRVTLMGGQFSILALVLWV